jgi:hypothetical protein
VSAECSGMTRASDPTDLTDRRGGAWPSSARWPCPAAAPLRRHARGRQREPLRAAQRDCLAGALPRDFPPGKPASRYFRARRRDGTRKRSCGAAREQLRAKGGRAASPSAAILHGPSAETTEGGPRGFDAAKQVDGRQRHSLVDRLGMRLVVVVHAADVQDSEGAKGRWGGSPGCGRFGPTRATRPPSSPGRTASGTGRSRSSHGHPTPRGSGCCHGGGWWSGPSPGWGGAGR